MNPKVLTYMLLTAIAVQAVFGGLQHTVSICLGGGHQHEVANAVNVANVVEHCEFECSHHSGWPAPITNDTDVENCDCTDLEFSLITLVSIPRNADDNSFISLPMLQASFHCSVQPLTHVSWHGPPELLVDDPAIRQQLLVVRTTRILV